MKRYVLHFSLDPVQGFVAQARRTRDLWAGSFLLSWLSGQAMAETLRRGGDIVFPAVGTSDAPRDPLLKAILGSTIDNNPHIGSLPNRFKAEVSPDFQPESIVESIRGHWRKLAKSVWQCHVQKVQAQGHGVQAIWNRQIEGFWDLQWVMGEDLKDNSDASWLDKRKNWRTHWPPCEGGDHCTIMGEWQELSGYTRARNRERQDAFWEAVRNKSGIGLLDLRDHERLCAIALVKRLFPKLPRQVLQETIGWIPGGNPDTVGNWPSTAYMSTVPWLLHIAAQENRAQALRRYVSTISDTVGNYFGQLAREKTTQLPGLKPLREKEWVVSGHSPADLDGNLFQISGLANASNTPLSASVSRDHEEDPDQEARRYLLKALGKLNREVGCARPFYAILLMDGDRLGQILRQIAPGDVSQALGRFTECVPKIVKARNGVTIYAGGDDVLALSPVPAAIECAIELRHAYQQAFAQLELNANAKPTVSCAIVFTHMHFALQNALQHAHRQLDDVAKEGNGRNSLALSILLAGGENRRWVACFDAAQTVLQLQAQIERKQYSTSFFYNLFHRYEGILRGDTPQSTEENRLAFDVALAEYCKGKSAASGEDRQQGREAVQLLLDACSRQRGDGTPMPSLQSDGVHISRFLAQCNITESIALAKKP